MVQVDPVANIAWAAWMNMAAGLKYPPNNHPTNE
jgi:hypothetical protein